MKIALFVLIIIIVSCNDEPRPPKELRQEKGVVVAMQYVAPEDGGGGSTSYNWKDGSISSGHISLHKDEKYMVVFRCEHGVVFSINSDELFAKLIEKDSVIIDYYEENRSWGDKFDFIDANKISK
jgi:hypothetical protein